MGSLIIGEPSLSQLWHFLSCTLTTNMADLPLFSNRIFNQVQRLLAYLYSWGSNAVESVLRLEMMYTFFWQNRTSYDRGDVRDEDFLRTGLVFEINFYNNTNHEKNVSSEKCIFFYILQFSVSVAILY